MRDKDRLGKAGERAAAKFLKRQGYRILHRNVKSTYGELDIVALEGGDLVFVEVKTRTDEEMGAPEEAITRSKRAHIIRSALAYVQSRKAEDMPMRFDVVGVEFDGKGRPECSLIRAAFDGEEGSW